MIELEDTTMTKKQYFIPQVETMPLFHANALCAGSGTPTPPPVSNDMNVNTGVETNEVW